MKLKLFRKPLPSRPLYSAPVFLLGLLCLSGCSLQKADIPIPRKESVIKIYGAMRYDSYGMPVFTDELRERPVDAQVQYIAVSYYGSRPEKFYHILITGSDSRPDMREPLKVIYQWSGRGFDVGYRYSKEIIEKSTKIVSDAPVKMPCCFAVLIPGYVVGGAIFITTSIGGFIVGVSKSIPATLEEFKKLGINRYEVILGSSVVTYDGSGRTAKIASYAPPPDETLLTETLFDYRGNGTVPHKAVNYSVPEKKSRVIYGR